MKIVVKSHLPKNPTADDVINLLLENRKITTDQDKSSREQRGDLKTNKIASSSTPPRNDTDNRQLITDNFFSPPHPTSLSLADFGFKKEYIDNAMSLVWSFYGSKKPIVVYSDYDADGITGGAILWETLHTLGFKAFPYIGNRIEEGYGFSKTGLDNVKRKYDPCLIISVDHGIAAKEMVKYAKNELNIPIIVTDHHHRQEDKVPDCAVSIFHIPALSGSGTAYYVAKEIAKKNSGQLSAVSCQNTIQKETEDSLAKMFASEYVGLAAIGTIADLVPLVGPSRAIAKHGLEALTKTKRAGIEALKEVSGNLGKTITTYEVGFMIAPRINASGRLADALTALRLLCTRDVNKAKNIAQKLQALNVERQDMVKKAVEEAVAIVEKMKDENGNLPKILIVCQSQVHSEENIDDKQTVHSSQSTVHSSLQAWHEGIIGLIASKLVEKYYRPAIVLTRQVNSAPCTVSSEENIDNKQTVHNSQFTVHSSYKASARSIYGFHLTDFLKNFTEYLSHFGGHAAAAGLSISGEKLPQFIEKATSMANTLITDDMLSPTIEVDCDLPLDCINMELMHKIETLEPYGVGNEKPKFVSSGHVSDIKIFGKDDNHLRFNMTEGPYTLPFVAFGKSDIANTLSGKIEAVYYVDINKWNGTEKIQAKLIKIV